MRIVLPFNLIAHLEGSSVAESFGLKNHYPDNHTVIELNSGDARDLAVLLTGLADELQARAQRLNKLASKSPLGVRRRKGNEEHLAAVRRAADILSARL